MSFNIDQGLLLVNVFNQIHKTHTCSRILYIYICHFIFYTQASFSKEKKLKLHYISILEHSLICYLEQFIARSSSHCVSKNFKLNTEEVAVSCVGKIGAFFQRIWALTLNNFATANKRCLDTMGIKWLVIKINL